MILRVRHQCFILCLHIHFLRNNVWSRSHSLFMQSVDCAVELISGLFTQTKIPAKILLDPDMIVFR